jgi:peroxiredoxin
MEIKKFKNKQNISFNIYQDKDNTVAKKLGIAFKLDPNVKKIYKKFKIDLEKNQENTKDELPMPGTYVINKKGEVTYSFVEPDYTKRLDPVELLKHL